MRKQAGQFTIMDFEHATPIQIRFVDIDKLGHVNNATILSYFETARVKFLDDTLRDNNWDETGLILAHSEVDYFEPVYLQDNIIAYTRIVKVGNKSFDIENILTKRQNGTERICSCASGILVCMDYVQKKTIEVPKNWREKLNTYRSIEPGTTPKP